MMHKYSRVRILRTQDKYIWYDITQNSTRIHTRTYTFSIGLHQRQSDGLGGFYSALSCRMKWLLFYLATWLFSEWLASLSWIQFSILGLLLSLQHQRKLIMFGCGARFNSCLAFVSHSHSSCCCGLHTLITETIRSPNSPVLQSFNLWTSSSCKEIQDFTVCYSNIKRNTCITTEWRITTISVWLYKWLNCLSYVSVKANQLFRRSSDWYRQNLIQS